MVSETMGTVQKLAEKVKEGLQTALLKLRKTVVNKLALAVGAMMEAQTPKTRWNWQTYCRCRPSSRRAANNGCGDC